MPLVYCWLWVQAIVNKKTSKQHLAINMNYVSHLLLPLSKNQEQKEKHSNPCTDSNFLPQSTSAPSQWSWWDAWEACSAQPPVISSKRYSQSKTASLLLAFHKNPITGIISLPSPPNFFLIGIMPYSYPSSLRAPFSLPCKNAAML